MEKKKNCTSCKKKTTTAAKKTRTTTKKTTTKKTTAKKTTPTKKIDVSELVSITNLVKEYKLDSITKFNTVRPLTKVFYDKLDGFFKNGKPNVIKRVEQVGIINVYNTTFYQQKSLTNCSPCIKPVITQLYQLYNFYKNNVELGKLK